MALDDLPEQYIPRNNEFYRDHYHHVLMSLMVIIALMMIMVGVVVYQMYHRPLPIFTAMQPDKQQMVLHPYDQPNLQPETILRWASKAATAAYTFDFVNYNQQIGTARPYFTADGWQDYLTSVRRVIETILQGKLFVNGVVAGAPVISNQGPLPGKGYVWRVQIPFLVVYQSANSTTTQNYYVVITIVQVPTQVNPQGIGIDQFVMVQ